ncbi:MULTISPECIES: TerB family tellurite resistance protein [Ahrensia]|uniref:TerB family tellurite resistance protein n=1 Tax=Ahrensia kielensis TaxID=76980 RepID=A0ABU9T8T7_9HYPH|nr:MULTISPECIES: TerB family tellurite resistance protein [Ahrensia]
MFDKILNFLGTLGEDRQASSDDFADNDPRLCATALMYHVIRADGVLRDVEKERFETLVRRENDFEGAELNKLLEAAKLADNEAIDLYKFTSVLRMGLEMEDRVHFVELLWELVYSDGERHELEDNVVWRISELLGVDGSDRVAMRQRVQRRMEGDAEG